MFIKICGITSLGDAEISVEAGADALGFNLWRGSKRFLPLENLRPVALAVAGRVERFGVFVNASVEEVEFAFAAGLIDVAQLHGDEEPSFCERFPGRYVKALRLGDAGDLEDLEAYDCSRFVVDAPSPGYGGAGQLMDEALARAACARAAVHDKRVILAGGLNPGNVRAVSAMVRPWGVDVASGVESAPGVKDPFLVAAFCRAARAV